MDNIVVDSSYFDAAAVKAKMLAYNQSVVDAENLAAAKFYGSRAESYKAAAKWALDNGQTPPERPLPPKALIIVVNKDPNGALISFDVAISDNFVAPPVDEVRPVPPTPAFHISLGAHIYGDFYVCGADDTCPADFVTPPIDGHSYRKVTYPFGAWYLKVS